MPASQHQPAWQLVMARRLAIVGGVFAVCVVAIVVRLVILQVVQDHWLVERSRGQREDVVEVFAQRGEILDRTGRILATSVGWSDVWVKRAKVTSPVKAAAALCGALGDCDTAEQARIANQLTRNVAKDSTKDTRQIRIRRQVDPEQARRLAALEMDGLSLSPAPHRCYPNRELAAHVLGFVGVEHNGQGGVEAAYDATLKGTPGKLLLKMDGGSKERKPFSRGGTPPVPGRTLELTIDANIQYVAEQALHDAVIAHQALGGSLIVMVPQTGAILALANEPTFNPNNIKLVPAPARINRAVQETYEPGSTFKIVTASAAIEEKLFRPTDMIDTGDGVIRFGSRTIPEFKNHRYGTLSFTDVIVKSSNVGAVKIGLRVGPDLISRYVERFGFGTRELRRELPGESRGQVFPASDLTESALASVSMGYQVGVTPLQMAVAASVVANEGELVEPHIVRAVIDGNSRHVVPRTVRHRVISRETASEITTMMEQVVERGTAQAVKKGLTGFTVAGKTGTATKVINRRYVQTDNVASFVGFVPSRNPALTIIVVIDTPRIPAHASGGVVAAPVFGRVADAALRYLGVPPTVNAMPPVLVPRADIGRTLTVSNGPATVTIVPAVAPVGAGQLVLPDVRGLAGRDALRVLSRIGITPHMTGDGFVVEQDPAPGTPVDFGAACRVVLARAIPGIQQ